MALFGLFGGKPSKDEFGSIVLERLKAAGEARPLRYEAQAFRIQVEDGEAFYLENAYRYYCEASKADRERVLAEFLASWAETSVPMPQTWAEASAKVRPYVRPLDYFALAALHLQLQGKAPRSLPRCVRLGEDLGIYLAFDLPKSITNVDRAELDKWGVSFEQALSQACDNLRGESSEPFQLDSPGVYVSPWRGPYDCSRLVLQELFRPLQVTGAPVAMAPNRDVLIVTGAEDRRGLQRMGEIAAEVLRQPRPLSAEALQLNPDGWVPFRLRQELAEHRALAELQQGQRMASYQEQKQLLEALQEKTGEDVFVATYYAAKQKDTGVVTSYSTWSEGVPTQLPKADTIVFVRPASKETFAVPWADAWEIVGHRMKTMDLFPPRYSVGQWPDEAECARLKAKAV